MRRFLLFTLVVSALFMAACNIYVVDPPPEVPKPFLAKFKNMLYTDISIEVDGYGSKVIVPGETVTFKIDKDDQSYHYEAETYGTTASGAQIGLAVDWQRTRDISGDSYTTNLITNNDLFFLKMRNNGYHESSPLYVNYGFSDQTMDNITIPGNGVLYNTGYYKAYSGTRVQANWKDMPSDYTYWQQGSHFHFPWTDNQSVTLLNNFKKDASGKDLSELSFEVETNSVKSSGDEPSGVDAGTLRDRTGSAL